MQEKESVNFFYYLNPMQIKKITKKAAAQQKNRRPRRNNKQNQANCLIKTFNTFKLMN